MMHKAEYASAQFISKQIAHHLRSRQHPKSFTQEGKEKKKNRKDYAFQRQFDEKPRLYRAAQLRKGRLVGQGDLTLIPIPMPSL